MSQVAVWIQFAIPSNNIDVVWHISEPHRFGDISGHQGEEYGDGEAEPEVCGREEEVVIAESVSGEPTRRNDGIDRLESNSVCA